MRARVTSEDIMAKRALGDILSYRISLLSSYCSPVATPIKGRLCQATLEVIADDD